MANKRAYAVTATTTIASVASYDTVSTNDHVSVENNGEYDVELYWGQTDAVDLHSTAQTFRAYDGFLTKGQLYVKSIGGSSPIVVHVWRERVS